jgi:hypothetical protein
MKEIDFKRWTRENYKGWSEAYEPRRGSGVGIPDLQFLVRGRLIPAELKIGEIKGEFVAVKTMRPSQIVWHNKFWKAGGCSILIVGASEYGEKKPSHVFFHRADSILMSDGKVLVPRIFGFEVLYDLQFTQELYNYLRELRRSNNR